MGLAFSDVLLIPNYTDIVTRLDIDLSTTLAKGIKLNLPLVSTNMSSVTESKMAITMALNGGMGLIHRFNTIKQEAKEVEKTKKHEFSLEKYPKAAVDKKGKLLVAASVGANKDFLDRAKELVKAGVDMLVMDIANGHNQLAMDAVKALKDKFPDTPIMAGNVATSEGIVSLADAGADCIKVGIGPGAICVTRIVTGVGVPQFTALRDCCRAAFQKKVTIISDGGCIVDGDKVKALAGGASAVIVAGSVAGTDASPGNVVKINGKSYKEYYGSASNRQMKKIGKFNRVPEGVEGFVPYTGKLEHKLWQYEGSLRSGFSYVGARNITQLWDKAKFMRITNAALEESKVHDLIGIN